MTKKQFFKMLDDNGITLLLCDDAERGMEMYVHSKQGGSRPVTISSMELIKHGDQSGE